MAELLTTLSGIFFSLLAVAAVLTAVAWFRFGIGAVIKEKIRKKRLFYVEPFWEEDEPEWKEEAKEKETELLNKDGTMLLRCMLLICLLGMGSLSVRADVALATESTVENPEETGADTEGDDEEPPECPLPVATVTFFDEAYFTQDGHGYFSDSVHAVLTVEDCCFEEETALDGLVIAYEGGQESEEVFSIDGWQEDEENESCYYAEITFLAEGVYTWSFAYENGHGQVAEVLSGSFTIDRTKPSGEIGITEYKWDKLLSVITFGRYSRTRVVVTVEARDTTSPIASVSYYRTAADMALSEEALQELDETDWVMTDVTDAGTLFLSDDAEQFTVYVKIIDYAGNTAYVGTDGFIVDNAASSIRLTPSAPSTDNENADVWGYYQASDAVSVAVSVEEGEIYSGIRQIVYWITDGTEAETDLVETHVLFADSAGENPTKDELTKNWNGEVLVDTEKYHTCTVTVYVQATDRAGNVSEQSVCLDIDTTPPSITVSFDNNTADNGVYYRDVRVASVWITEKHFDPSGVVFSIETTGDELPDIGEWTRVESGKTNGEADVYLVNITFSADGDYTFAVECTDLAGNQTKTANAVSGTTNPTAFTIDRTIEAPVITGVEDGGAYNGDIAFTIAFSDRNFADYDLSLTRTSLFDVDSDVTQSFLGDITLTTDGGCGTCRTIAASQENDGIYTLNVQVSDLAGNTAETTVRFSVNRFGSVYVLGEYVRTLIGNNGAYVQAVDRDLVITEYNADPLVLASRRVEITLDGHSLEDVSYTVSGESAEEAVDYSGWYTYVYTIHRKNFSADGTYKIAISSTDAAGNQSESRDGDDKILVFRVDSTAPEITSITGLEEEVIHASEQEVRFVVYDTIGLKKVQIYIDDEQLGEDITDFGTDANNYEGVFVLTESKTTQHVRILAEDLAGNVVDTDNADAQFAYAFYRDVTVTGTVLNTALDTVLDKVLDTVLDELSVTKHPMRTVPLVAGAVGISVAVLLARRKLRRN